MIGMKLQALQRCQANRTAQERALRQAALQCPALCALWSAQLGTRRVPEQQAEQAVKRRVSRARSSGQKVPAPRCRGPVPGQVLPKRRTLPSQLKARFFEAVPASASAEGKQASR